MQVVVEAWRDEEEVGEVVGTLYPKLQEHRLLDKIADIHALLTSGAHRGGGGGQGVAGVRFRRVMTTRDLLKFCGRVSAMLPAVAEAAGAYLTEAVRQRIVREGMDCFSNLLPVPGERLLVARRLAAVVDVPQDQVDILWMCVCVYII